MRDNLGVEFGKPGALRIEMPGSATVVRVSTRESSASILQATGPMKGKAAQEATSAESKASLGDMMVGFSGHAFSGMAGCGLASASAVSDLGGAGVFQRPMKLSEAPQPASQT